MKLDGKVALITGAASGIGRAIAKRFLEADGRVVIADLKADGAKASAKELAGEKSAIGVGMDVSKEDQVNAGVEETVKTFGRVDILVSNAEAFRSYIRSRSFPSPTGKSCSPSISMARSSPPRPA
jgi:3-hydroxybutyrate dehydrogenase